MGNLFAPYKNDSPAAIEINGHKLLILTMHEDDMTEELSIVGGNKVRELDFGDDDTKAIASLVESINAGVVLTPPGMKISTMIRALKEELPWVH
jgi:hypothetical protein